MPSIRRPSVEVTQTTVTTTPTILTPDLPACIIGPCVQIVSAFDDDGDLQAEALAGTYTDDSGTIAYTLPGLKSGADPDPYVDEIRVFMVTGSEWTELDGESDEETIVAVGAADGTYVSSTKTFTSPTGNFVSDGVEEGDAIRIAYAGRTFDLIIATSGVTSDTTLVAEADLIGEDLTTAITWSIIRNPAQFVYQTAESQASVAVITDEGNYITFLCVDSGAYDGADGDSLSLVIEESDVEIDGANLFVGGAVFFDDTTPATFLADVGAEGAVTGKLLRPAAVGDGVVFRDILYVVSDDRILIEGGEAAGGSSLNWSVGSEITFTSTAITYTHGTTTITVTGGNLTSVINLNAGKADATAGEVYVEMVGDGTTGVWKVDPTSTVLDGSLVLTGVGPGAGMTTLTSLTILQESPAGSTGANGETEVAVHAEIPAAAGVDFTTDIPTPVTEYAVVVTSGTSGQTIASVETALTLTLSTTLGTLGDIDYEVVEHTTDLVLALDTDNDELTLTLARGATGVSSSTYASIDAALVADTALNLIVDTVVTNSGTITVADVGTYAFDGGVDDSQLLLDGDLLGSTTPTGQVYVSYKALRMDVTAEADTPALLSYNTTTEADAAIGPINTTENPLGLGMYFALTNSPSNPVKGIGVGAPDSTDSDWTTAWQAALDFLLGQKVYALAPMTQDPSIHALIDTHITAASLPANKAERVAFINQVLPTYSTATVIASGTAGNTGDVSSTEEFETSFDFSLLTDPPAAGDILVVAAKSAATEVPSVVNGTIGPVYGIEIDAVKTGDNFVLDLDATEVGEMEALGAGGWDNLVDVTWTLYRAGSAITAASDQATAVADVGTAFANKRLFNVWPGTVTAALDGTEQNIPGMYLAAAWAGLCGEETPQTPFTNRTVAGFTALKNANGYFTEAQLDEMAGGGTFVCIQESSGAKIACRHQLSTDTSTLENRELSITKAVDYAATFLRDSLTSQIGKFNITDQYLTALSVTVQSLLRWFVETGLVRSAQLITLEQDSSNADTVNITVLLEVLYPANYIAITLEV